MNYLLKHKRGFRLTILVALTAVVTILLFWVLLPDSWQSNESSDYRFFYEPVARQIMSGKGFTMPEGKPATSYPPGFPVLLTFVFSSANLTRISDSDAISLFICIAMVITAILIFWLARSVLNPTWAYLAVFLWCTYPFSLWATKQPNSEIAFLPFLYAAILLVWSQRRTLRARSLAIAGLLLGCAMLIRPAALGLPLVFALFVFFWGRQHQVRWFMPVCCLLFGSLIVVLPWLLWLQTQTGEFTLLSTNGVASIRDGLTFAVESKDYRIPLPIATDMQATMLDFRSNIEANMSVAQAGTIVAEAIFETPQSVIRLFVWKALRSWYATDSHRGETLNALIQSLYLVAAVVGSIVGFRSRGIKRDFIVFAVALTSYFWFMTILVLSILRYMMPTMGLLLIVATIGIQTVWHRVRRQVYQQAVHHEPT